MKNASVKRHLRGLGSGWVEFGDISRWDQASSMWGSAALLLGLTIFLLVLGAYLFRENELA